MNEFLLFVKKLDLFLSGSLFIRPCHKLDFLTMRHIDSQAKKSVSILYNSRLKMSNNMSLKTSNSSGKAKVTRVVKSFFEQKQRLSQFTEAGPFFSTWNSLVPTINNGLKSFLNEHSHFLYNLEIKGRNILAQP